ncbi:MAG: hypothetical protein ABI432_15520 [Flavobacteriales bacterium]
MRTRRSKILSGALALCLLPSAASAQCPNNNMLIGAAITVACPGSTSVACLKGGEYVLVNVTLGNVYTFGVCNATYNTLITLFNNAGGGNVGWNDDGCNGNRSVVQWTATFTGQLRVLLDRNNCNTNGACSVLDITCAFPDDPCTATTLPVNAACVNLTATNLGATGTAGPPAPGCGGYSGSDVWFKATVPATGGFTVTGSTVGGSALTDGAIAIYSAPACGGAYTLISCNDNTVGNMPQLTVSCRTPGEMLYVRFWENGNDAFGQFNICAVAAAVPANDDPCAATVLGVASSCTTVQGTTAGSTGSAVATPSCANFLGRDVWFQLVVPATGNIIVTTSTVGGSALTDGGLAIYTAGACATAGTFTELACSDDIGGGNLMSSITRTGLTPGQTIYVRVWSKGNATCGTFNICAYDSNDEPCTAIALPVNASCVNTASTNIGATSTAGVPGPGCDNYSGGDVWFTATVPSSGGFTVTGSTVGGSALTNGAMAIYSAPACGGAYTLVSCNDNTVGNMPQLTVNCRTPGEVLYIRFWESGNNSYGQFNICAVPTSVPTNDDPCAATALTVGTTCAPTQGSTAGSTGSSVATPSCANFLGRDVWYQLTVPANGNLTVTTSTVAGSALTDGGIAIYTAGACATAASFTEIACNDDIGGGNLMSSIALTGQTPGQTLYVRVWQRGNTACGAFNICAANMNDEPCTAISLTVGASCSMASYGNAGYTQTAGVVAPGCGNFTGASLDAWFTFTAPASGVAIIESAAGTMTDGSMALYYAASCASASLSLVECSADEGPGNMPWLRFVDLLPGGTYYLRFWGDGNDVGTFDLCVWSPAYAPGNCSYMLEMYDSGANGWGTSEVQIQLDAGPVNHYTVASGQYNAVIFGTNIGQILYLTYVNTGPNQAQNRYFLRQIPGGNGVFLGGPTPTAGLVFFETIDCVPPPPPAEDCRGSVPICNAQSFSNNAAGTGFDMDLRAGTFGCLASSERQGTWYRFSPSASGVIGMTIAPTNGGDDYDFAVWGPYASVTCPPSGPPVRCSYSGATGNTGMGNGAVDLSEGAGGDKWVAPLNAIAGEIYSLYISNFSQSGLAFNLNWQLSGGASLDCTLLPVELLDLSAKAQNEAIEVTWTTASELNSDHFIVERSEDMVNFDAIGTMVAAGTSVQVTHYTYLDEAPREGLNYYRLQQVDADGSSTTSRSVYAVYRRATTEMVVFPNPAGDILYASFELPEDDAVIYRVLDASGRLVEQDLYHGTKGNMLIDIPLDRLSPGSYTLLVNDTFGTLNGSAQFIRQ